MILCTYKVSRSESGPFSSCRLLVRFAGLVFISFANLGRRYALAVEVDAESYIVRIDMYVETRAQRECHRGSYQTLCYCGDNLLVIFHTVPPFRKVACEIVLLYHTRMKKSSMPY